MNERLPMYIPGQDFPEKRLSRKDFLRVSAIMIGGVAITLGCGVADEVVRVLEPTISTKGPKQQTKEAREASKADGAKLRDMCPPGETVGLFGECYKDTPVPPKSGK